jgi:hypothetical protein
MATKDIAENATAAVRIAVWRKRYDTCRRNAQKKSNLFKAEFQIIA